MKLSTVKLDEFVNAVQQNKCPFCKQTIDTNEFKNLFNLKEFEITGICQKCQDETFNKDEI